MAFQANKGIQIYIFSNTLKFGVFISNHLLLKYSTNYFLKINIEFISENFNEILKNNHFGKISNLLEVFIYSKKEK